MPDVDSVQIDVPVAVCQRRAVTTTRRETFHHGDLRNQLVRAAARELSLRGAARFSLRAVARDVGVAPNAAYHHFANREDLLHELATDGFARLARTMEAAVAEADGALPRLVATGTAYLAFARDHPAVFEVMFGSPRPRRPPRDGEDDTVPAPDRILSRQLDECVAAGVLSAGRRDSAEALLWPAVHGLAVLQRDGMVASDSAAQERFLVAVRTLLGEDPPPDAAPR